MMVFLRFIIVLMLLLNYAIGTAQSDSIKRTPSDSLKLTDSTAYGIVEQMPAFIGKDGSLTNFVKRNITYPQTLRENGISGQVWVYFIISKDSTVKRVWIDPVRSTDQRPFIDEALRVMRTMDTRQNQWQGCRCETAYSDYISARIGFKIPLNFTENY